MISRMTKHSQLAKEQLQHMVLGTLLFVCMASIASGLDPTGEAIVKLDGVSNFTYQAIEITAHILLSLDLLLFALYLYKSSLALIKEIFS